MKVKVISLPFIFQVLYVLCFTRSRYQVSVYRTNGPLVLVINVRFDHCKVRVFFIFRFTDPPNPIFWKLEKEIFFQFYHFISLRLMPVQYWSSVMFFRFVFSIAARLIKLPPVTAPGEILPF